MKYIIAELLGKQYLFQSNFWYDIPFLKCVKLNDYLLINRILLINLNNIIQIGYPYINNVFIISKILKKKIKSKKILILKFKRKKKYKRLKGYKSYFTRIIIKELSNLNNK
jgi:large subunit ribosomal protein L21